ncbi:MAG: hypothetical protein ACRCX8_12525 [Sarcina sp.]
MRILEVELINHAVIPESFHINLRNKSDVICIDGLNGSGKSFLINNIHPLATNKRSKDRYSIRKGKRGLKRIIYELDKDCELEVIHEYVVNGARHSCKSYCNMIEHGIKRELNPTGHTGSFEDIIKKLLYFDSDSFVCSFLSPKAESVVNATSGRRKEILKNTMKSSKILERVTSKNREKITELNTTIKVYNKQMEESYNTLPFKTIDEFESEIKSKEQELSRTKDSLMISKEELMDMHKLLSGYENMDINDVDRLKSYIEVLGALELVGMTDAFDKLDKRKRNLNILEFKLKTNKERIIDIEDQLSSVVDKDGLTSKVRKLEQEIESIESTQKKFNLNIDNTMEVMRLLGGISQVLSNCGHNFNPSIRYSDIETLRDTIAKNTKTIEHLVKEVNTFNSKINACNDVKETDLEIDKGPNCETCELYIKHVKNFKYILENMDKHNSNLKDLESLEFENVTLNMLLKYGEELIELTSSLSKLTTLREINGYIDLMDIKQLINKSISSYDYPKKISEFVQQIKYNSQNINKLKYEVSNIYKELSNAKTVNSIELNRELDTLNKELSSLRKQIQDDVAFIDIFDEFNVRRGSQYDDMSLNDLETIYDKMVNTRDYVRNTRNKIAELTRSIQTYETNVTRLQNLIWDLTNKQNTLTSINNHLISLKNDLKKFTMLKGIIEKRIPLELLEGNMSFIENTVNTIMEENEINLTLDIKIEDTDIRMEVTTRNQTVDDISLCSSGELCLLGVVLNAVLMHIIGYSIISFDEMDSNLDVVYRESFHNVIYSILEKLDIEQVFCVSHNISFDMCVGHIVIGEYDRERLHGEIIDY